MNDFERVIEDLLLQQVFFINISGGEPFTHPKISKILRVAHESFKHVMVLSNGTILKKKHEETIREIIKNKGFYTTQISLDAIDAATNERTRGQTKLVLANIERLNEMGANVIIATVVNRFNINQIETQIKKLERYTRCFHLMTVQDVRTINGVEKRFKIPHEVEVKLWEKMAALAEKRNLFINTPMNYEGDFGCAKGAPCMAAFSHLVVDPNLKVRPCDRLTDVVIGDLNNSSIEEIWNGDKVKPLLEGYVPYCRQNIKSYC